MLLLIGPVIDRLLGQKVTANVMRILSTILLVWFWKPGSWGRQAFPTGVSCPWSQFGCCLSGSRQVEAPENISLLGLRLLASSRSLFLQKRKGGALRTLIPRIFCNIVLNRVRILLVCMYVCVGEGGLASTHKGTRTYECTSVTPVCVIEQDDHVSSRCNWLWCSKEKQPYLIQQNPKYNPRRVIIHK